MKSQDEVTERERSGPHPMQDEFVALWDHGGPPDPGALRSFAGRLFDRDHNRVIAIAIRRIGDREAAREICSEVFTKAYKAWLKRDALPESISLAGYISTTCENLCKNWLRENSRLNEVSLTPTDPDDEDDRRAELGTDVDEGPEAQLLDAEDEAEQTALLRSALSKLEPKMLRVIELRYYEEMEYEDIAETLGITKANARQIAHRALVRLGTITGQRRELT